MATQVVRTAVPAPLAARWGLLPSRILPPVSRASDVLRDDLVGILIASPVPIASVIAPGGYGKSTLLAQFAERDPRSSAWLSVGEDADDPVTLARYLVLALDPVTPIDEVLVRELDGPHPRMRLVTAGLAAAIRAADTPFILVVDDVHLLADGRCFALLRALAREVPPRSSVAFVARYEMPLGLARTRAAGELLELGIGDLRFGADDAADLLRGAGAGEIGAENAARLTDQTEGWAVGLYLAARSLAADPTTAPSFGGDDRYVADYLRETMLADLPDPEVAFLIQSSVLEELSGPLCDATLATTGSGAMLETLESSNLLVVPLDRRRDRYRYHHLFRDLLRMELEHRAPELVPALTARASAWCETEGLTDLAVMYAIAGNHVDRVAELIARYAQATYYGGRASAVRAWIEWFGEHGELERFPIAAVLGAWFHAAEQHPVEAERWIDSVAPADATGTPGREQEAIRALLAATMGREGVERMLADAERASALLPAASRWRPNVSLLAGLSHVCKGELVPASRAFHLAAERAREMGVAIAWALAHAEVAIVALELGDVAGAATQASTAKRIVEEGTLQGYPTSALTYAIGARVALVQGDPVRARACAEEAASIDPGLSYAMPVFALQADLLLARCAMGLGDAAWAEGFLTHADDVIAHRPDLGTLVPEVAMARDELRVLRASAVGAPSLTPAEARLLPMLTTHLSFREIGGELFVSPHTVKTQAISIYRKLGVSSRGEAVRVAREIGLLTP
ncbi:MAG: LuxR C-terminal-related transcriptional regulator [Actinomycetota bacterium]